MRPRLQVQQISGVSLRRLRRMYDRALCPRLRRRAQTILLTQQGSTSGDMARITRQSQMNVRRLMHRFDEGGCNGLLENQRSGRPADITPAIENYLRVVIKQSPRHYGYGRPGWTTQLLAKFLRRQFQCEVTDECIRQHLERAGIVCRRPTWTVKHKAQIQPGYAQKKAGSQGF